MEWVYGISAIQSCRLHRIYLSCECQNIHHLKTSKESHEFAKLLQHHIRHRRKTKNNLNRMAKKNDYSKMSCRQKESSSSEEQEENAKSAVQDETVTSKLVEDKIPKAELILFLDELVDSQPMASSH